MLPDTPIGYTDAPDPIYIDLGAVTLLTGTGANTAADTITNLHAEHDVQVHVFAPHQRSTTTWAATNRHIAHTPADMRRAANNLAHTFRSRVDSATKHVDHEPLLIVIHDYDEADASVHDLATYLAPRIRAVNMHLLITNPAPLRDHALTKNASTRISAGLDLRNTRRALGTHVDQRTHETLADTQALLVTDTHLDPTPFTYTIAH